jgi:hypothetical protein
MRRFVAVVLMTIVALTGMIGVAEAKPAPKPTPAQVYALCV